MSRRIGLRGWRWKNRMRRERKLWRDLTRASGSKTSGSNSNLESSQDVLRVRTAS